MAQNKDCNENNGPQLVYFRGEIVPFEEDNLHEFKGHRVMTIYDLDAEMRKARQFWSKYICGFLNTGLGGTLYGGITDSGQVKGFSLSKYQRRHVELAVTDIFNNFKPGVPDEVWSIEFVPVVEKGATTYQKDSTVVDQILWDREHRLRDSRWCWCDEMARGGKNQLYVVEVRMKPWVEWAGRKDQLELGWGKDQPSFMAEDGQYYMRKFGTTDMYTEDQMNQLRTEQRRERRMMERMRRDGVESCDGGGDWRRALENAFLEAKKMKEEDAKEKVDDDDVKDDGGICSIT